MMLIMNTQLALSQASASPLKWERGVSGTSEKNVRRRIKGFKPMTEEKFVSAHLGRDRTRHSSFIHSSDSLSVSAIVRKGADRDVCQDAAFVCIGPKITLLGVVDGFGPAGTAISQFVADGMVALAASGNKDPLKAIIEGIGSMEIPEPPLDHGGATAACVMLYPGGSFCMSSISDSAAFRFSDNGFRRLGHKYGIDNKGVSVKEKGLDDYFNRRHLVSKVIQYGRCNVDFIQYDGGLLYPGEGIILSTDGLTKNLSIRYDPATRKVLDNSHLDDMESLLRGTRNPQDATDALLSAIKARLRMPRESGKYLEMGDSHALYPEGDDVAIVAACI